MPTETIHLSLTPEEAVKLVYALNISYLNDEAILNTTTDAPTRKRLRKSMTNIQNLRDKIRTACINRS